MFRITGSLNVPQATKLLSTLKGQSSCTSVLKPLQAANICRKEEIDPEIIASKPKPFPWEKRPYTQLHGFFGVDRCVNRFDENTVVISIEGNIGVGKSTFGKALSDALGTRFYPEPDVSMQYRRADGFDYRALNYKLPEAAHYMDAKLFYLNPDHPAVPQFELTMFLLRVWQYLEGLSHVLSTGQGIVTDRSPWSSYAFQTASHKMKFGRCGKSFYRLAKHFRDELTPELCRPHVVIYLDAPSEVCLERVKKRGIDYEVNSRAMCKEYLEHIEFTYKDHILPELEAHAELLVYDWTNPPDLDLVIDDLSRLNVHDRAEGEKMEDWRFNAEHFYDLLRKYYTVERDNIYSHFEQDVFWIPDVLFTPEEIDHKDAVLRILEPAHDLSWKTDTTANLLKSLFRPLWMRGTYMDRKDFKWFNYFAPRRPTAFW